LSAGSAPADVAVQPRAAEVARAVAALPADAAGLEITFSADPHAFDGRFANNGWLQELPDGMHKMTWGNAAAMSGATAGRLGVVDGDLIAIQLGGAEVKVPALVAPGQADDSIALTVGQGRRVTGRVAKDVGYDMYPIRHTAGFDVASGATVAKAGGNEPLARTQDHFLTEGRPLVLEATAVEFAKDPEIKKEDPKAPPLLALWKEHSYPEAAWGMTIDLNQCNGCNACVVACQAENNIPVVGRKGVFDSREMNWIRIDRYFEGSNPEEPEALAQPMLCQHCENAPCEQVCPVGATTHSPEGLNEMAYNRCIGTKYCGNNCPYKVRRFNYFNYSIDLPESRKAQFNPDVTVRFRGVMEKCTFCVQRINHAKIDAKKDGRSRVRDGEVQSACQQACPTNAIHFGDLHDESSDVAQRAKSGRAYKLLEELNVKPRISYLARIKNPNPELAGA
jgi:molybdopterin-containing oxidoreductase family iron-sulfur binding subunit